MTLVKSYTWRMKGEEASSSVFVQFISFQDPLLWIWIGDASSKLNNLSLALKSRKVEKPKLNDIFGTTVISSFDTQEASPRAKSMAQRVSLLLGGRPVYLSYACADQSAPLLQELDAHLFQFIKENKENFLWRSEA